MDKAGSSDFSQIALVIDGFTRFSAEEERDWIYFIARCRDCYWGPCSKKAHTNCSLKGISPASVEFLHHLGQNTKHPFRIVPSIMRN